MRILGIDTSLTGTGLARIDLSVTGVDHVRPGVGYPHDRVNFDMDVATVGAPKPGKDKSKRAMVRRVNVLMDGIESAFTSDGLGHDLPDAVGIEGLAYGAGNSSAWVLAWVFGRTIELCEKHDVPLTVVAPTARIKFAMGKGGGPGTDKDHVLAMAIKLFPAADISGNNEADAAIVGAVVCQQLGVPILPVTNYRTEVMAKLDD